VIGQQPDALGIGATKQRGQNVARAVGVGKELAVGLLVHGDAQRHKEAHGIAGRERSQHASGQRPAAAPEVAVRHDPVRDVAAPAATDENLRAGLPGAVEQQHGPRRVGTTDEDRRRNASGARSDDDDVGHYTFLHMDVARTLQHAR
jgi:hypothetical protein